MLVTIFTVDGSERPRREWVSPNGTFQNGTRERLIVFPIHGREIKCSIHTMVFVERTIVRYTPLYDAAIGSS